MIDDLQGFYLDKEEPTKSCLMALRSLMLTWHPDMTETWTHRMPMFRYKGKLFSYLWVDKKTYEPYIGIYRGVEIDHPLLVQGNRNKMKTLTIDPTKDLPVDTIRAILAMAVKLY